MQPVRLSALFLRLALFVPGLALAAEPGEQSGAALLAMCKGADQVRALSVMCHSYTNGFIDATAHHVKRTRSAPDFCLGAKDRARLPGVLVEWLAAHPEGLKQPAAQVLYQALSANFPCPRK